MKLLQNKESDTLWKGCVAIAVCFKPNYFSGHAYKKAVLWYYKKAENSRVHTMFYHQVAWGWEFVSICVMRPFHWVKPQFQSSKLPVDRAACMSHTWLTHRRFPLTIVTSQHFTASLQVCTRKHLLDVAKGRTAMLRVYSGVHICLHNVLLVCLCSLFGIRLTALLPILEKYTPTHTDLCTHKWVRFSLAEFFITPSFPSPLDAASNFLRANFKCFVQ